MISPSKSITKFPSFVIFKLKNNSVSFLSYILYRLQSARTSPTKIKLSKHGIKNSTTYLDGCEQGYYFCIWSTQPQEKSTTYILHRCFDTPIRQNMSGLLYKLVHLLIP
uniref:Candidate secreted effector n=1 Tax=Meloidogyne incognita TaxID=6306 RepID=A0A914MZ85_MELIC